MVKTDVSDHFPIILVCEKILDINDNTPVKFFKRTINDKSVKRFREIISVSNWELVTENNSTEHSFNAFQENFSRGYDTAFPKKEIVLKPKTLNSPWMTKSLIKSSKRKQKLYEKFLKSKTQK